MTGDAENQQERLVEFRGWVIGFVDGEGCFSIGFTRQAGGVGRSGYRAGYQVFHRFVVTQGERSKACLEDVQRFFGVGRVFVNRQHDNHKEHLCQYHVSRRNDLLGTIIPFFQEYPLRTAKRYDFEAFSRCMEIVASGRHLARQGLADIAEITQTMNHQKPRHELIRILRDHTPEALDTGS